jgi:Glycosyl transferase family 11
MITCELIGGLGNQLFEISTTLALAWEHQDTAVFNLSGHRHTNQGNRAGYYRKTIYRNLTDRWIWWSRYKFKEQGHHYQPIAYRSGLKLIGYFQSEKYFIKYRQNLLDLFAPTNQTIDQLKSEYGFILDRPNCAMHIRRGDYFKYPQNHPICSIDYYQTAIDLFDRDTTFLVFSDDINWCKNIFSDRRFIFSENNSEEIDLYLMSMCQHQIIANSSFSWWGSWLNQNPTKQIVAPKHWFGSELQHLGADDIYTPSMLKI